MGLLNERIAKLMEEKNVTSGALARMTGITYDGIHKVVKGDRQPTFGTLRKIADALGVSILYFTGEEDQPQSERAPEKGETYRVGQFVQLEIVAEIACGPAGSIERREGGYALFDVSLNPSVGTDSDQWYWLRIQGDSMRDAGFYPGGLALIHRQATVDNGEIAVVCIDGDTATLKRVLWHPELNAVELRTEAAGYASQFLPVEQVCILGRARGAYNQC
jgi:repressor LexA